MTAFNRAIVLLYCLLCITSCTGPRPNPRLENNKELERYLQTNRFLNENEKRIIRQAVIQRRDPTLARFRWDGIPKKIPDIYHYCGQVFMPLDSGALDGFRPFIVYVELHKGEIWGATLIEVAPDRFNTQSVAARCRDFGLNPFPLSDPDI
jgi:hypothetical protein